MTTNEHKTNTPRHADEGAAGAERIRFTDFPALASLRLADDDLHELSHQGFVGQESRGNLSIFKLRFRRRNHQVVRYIGDAGQAAAVRTELARASANFNQLWQRRT